MIGAILTLIFGLVLLLGSIGLWFTKCLIPLIAAIINAPGFGGVILAFLKLCLTGMVLVPVLILELFIVAAIWAVIDSEA